MWWILTTALLVPAASPPTVLTYARDIRLLAPDRAALGLPVCLEAVITYIDAGNTVFVQDATAGTHVHDLPRDPNWRWGYRVRIEGKTMPGLYIPGIRATRIESLGPGEPPESQQVTFDDLASGVFHYQLVEVVGIGRSAVATGENSCIVHMAVGSRMLELRVDEVPPEDVNLVDAEIRVEGLAAGVINNRRQLVSPYLKVRSFRKIKVIDPPPDPSRLDVVSVDGLLRFTPEGTTGRRVKVRGIVTALNPANRSSSAKVIGRSWSSRDPPRCFARATWSRCSVSRGWARIARFSPIPPCGGLAGSRLPRRVT